MLAWLLRFKCDERRWQENARIMVIESLFILRNTDDDQTKENSRRRRRRRKNNENKREQEQEKEEEEAIKTIQ